MTAVSGIHADEPAATDPGDRVPGSPVRRGSLPDSRAAQPRPALEVHDGGVTVYLSERRSDRSRQPRLVHLSALGSQRPVVCPDELVRPGVEQFGGGGRGDGLAKRAPGVEGQAGMGDEQVVTVGGAYRRGDLHTLA